jgi:hypothetical protein
MFCINNKGRTPDGDPCQRFIPARNKMGEETSPHSFMEISMENFFIIGT